MHNGRIRTRIIVTALLLILPTILGCRALADESLERVGQVGGVTSGMAVSGHYAYVGSGPRILVIDVSDPLNPVKVGQSDIQTFAIRDLALSGDTLYVAAGQPGIRIFDISNPEHPTHVGYFHMNYYSSSLKKYGSYLHCLSTYFVQGMFYQPHVIDISSPRSPVLRAVYPVSDSVADIAIQGNYAYLVRAHKGLEIFDITDIANPVHLSFGPQPDGFYPGIELAGNHAYITEWSRGMDILDISNPSAPVALSTFAGYYMSDVLVQGATAYIAADVTGLQVVDVSDPVHPALLCTDGTTKWVGQLLAYGLCLLSARNGLHVYDISAPETTSHVRHLDIGLAGQQFDISGNYIYASDGYAGLSIIDVSDPVNPVQAARCNVAGDEVNDVKVQDGYAYVASRYGLQIFDVADPRMPVYIGGYDTLLWGVSIDVDGNSVYLGTQGKLYVIDVGNKQLPSCVAVYEGSGFAQLTVQDGRLYARTGLYYSEGSLLVLDVSDPTKPVPIGPDAPVTGIRGLDVRGRYAYAGTGDQHLNVLDISDPTAPVLVGQCDTYGNVYEVDVVGSRVAMGINFDGVQMADVSNPAAPVCLPRHSTVGEAFEVTAAGPYVYVLDKSGGLYVYHTGALCIDDAIPAAGANTGGPCAVTITGANFQPGATVKLSRTGSADIPASDLNVSSNEVTCSFDLTGAPIGLRDIVVTNPDGASASLTDGFAIRESVLEPPAPVVTGVNPSLILNYGSTNINIIGTDFLSGATVRLTMPGQSDLLAAGALVTSPTLITCAVDCDYRQTGRWNVVVRNPGGQSDTLEQGLEIASAIRTAKLLPNDAPVHVSHVVVTAVLGDYYYVEPEDRTAGLLVYRRYHGRSAGDLVGVQGSMKTLASGERYLDGDSVYHSFGVGSVDPILMSVRSVGGGSWFYESATGAGQKGVTGSLGLNNMGLLVSIVGRVTYVGVNLFWVDDGSGVRFGAYRGVKVQANGLALPAQDSYVKVTGISSCYVQGSYTNRVILTRSQSDIAPIQP